jgi:hypothetical protein
LSIGGSTNNHQAKSQTEKQGFYSHNGELSELPFLSDQAKGNVMLDQRKHSSENRTSASPSAAFLERIPDWAAINLPFYTYPVLHFL